MFKSSEISITSLETRNAKLDQMLCNKNSAYTSLESEFETLKSKYEAEASQFRMLSTNWESQISAKSYECEEAVKRMNDFEEEHYHAIDQLNHEKTDIDTERNNLEITNMELRAQVQNLQSQMNTITQNQMATRSKGETERLIEEVKKENDTLLGIIKSRELKNMAVINDDISSLDGS